MHLILWIINFANHLYLTENLQFSVSCPLRSSLLVQVNAGRDMCFGKLHLLIHVKIHMIHATDLELHQECAHIFLQVSSSAADHRRQD